MVRRLQRGRNRMLFGVAGGIADYFRIDPVIVRVIFILLVFANGLGILLYALLALLMPRAGAPDTKPLAAVKENLRTAPQDAREAGRKMVQVLRGAPPEREQPHEEASVQGDGAGTPRG